jgi:hypothetical protein
MFAGISFVSRGESRYAFAGYDRREIMEMRGALVGVALLAWAGIARGAGDYGGSGLAGGYRWDAAPRTISGRERSLDGGLRYSLQGGSYQAYRDLFAWQIKPSVADFQLAVAQAFHAWTVDDQVTGLGTTLSFLPDLATPVVGTGAGGINAAGAEIDLLAATDANLWNPGDSGTRAETYFSTVSGTVTLTSGTSGYAASPIAGADITLNDNSQAHYTLDIFRLLLTHEIGHALGLADVDVQSGPAGTFIDDNYNGATSATALATLTNSWAKLVNVTNPSASAGLHLYTVANANPGFDTPGVNILMESEGLGGQYGNLTPMSNDDYGGRQFLYPTTIPEPACAAWIALAIACHAIGRCRRRRNIPHARECQIT